MRTEYYCDYPRDFANEYSVFAVNTPADRARLLQHYPNAHRISRRLAEYRSRGKALDPTIPFALATLLHTRETLEIADDVDALNAAGIGGDDNPP